MAVRGYAVVGVVISAQQNPARKINIHTLRWSLTRIASLEVRIHVAVVRNFRAVTVYAALTNAPPDNN